MTDDTKHDDKDRKKVSDEELEDVAGGVTHTGAVDISRKGKKTGKGKNKAGYVDQAEDLIFG